MENNKLSVSRENLRSLWEDDTYKLWSLYDMLRIVGERLYDSMTKIQFRKDTLATGRTPNGWVNTPLTPDEREAVRSELTALLAICEDLGLSSPVTYIGSMLQSLDTSTAPHLYELYFKLHEDMIIALKSHHFFHIPPTKLKFYKSADDLFGKETVKRFQKLHELAPGEHIDISLEIRDAGECLAFGNNTAAVCHLMRVLEIGLNHLAARFSVNFKHTNWGQVIRDLHAAIEAEDKRIEALSTAQKPPSWKEDRAFYKDAATQFTMFEFAWRNYAMHAKSRYDEERAEEIYNGVRSYMRKLAERLPE